MPEVQQHERTHAESEMHPRTRPARGVQLLPGEVRLASTHTGSILDDPDLAGTPVALAHARAARENHAPSAGAGHPLGTALLFLVVAPTLILLVSNPLGWVILLGLCFGFAYLFGFGGIL